MPQCCAVPFCSERKGGHMFPKDKTVLKQWLVAIRRNNYTPTKHSRVCKKHFSPEDYMLPKESNTENPIPKLKPKVVPSKFPWNQESEERKEFKRKRTERAHQREKKKLGTATLSSNTECSPSKLQSVQINRQIIHICNNFMKEITFRQMDKDTKNYMKYKMGFNQTVPTKFHFQEDCKGGLTDADPSQPSTSTALNVSVPGGGEERTRVIKIERQDTDPKEGPSERPKAERPNLGQSWAEFSRSSPKEQNEFAVTVYREDGAKLDDAAAANFKDKLADLIEAAVCEEVPGSCLSFAASGLLSEGFFLVTPLTEEAKDWLLGCDFGTYNGVPVRCRLLNRCRVVVWIPNTRKMPADPLKLIRGQNTYRMDLKLSEWILLHREMQPLGMRLVVGVPQDVIDNDPGYVWLNFQATQIQARLLRQKPSEVKRLTRTIDQGTQTDSTPTGSKCQGCLCRVVTPLMGAPRREQMDIGDLSKLSVCQARHLRPVSLMPGTDERTRAQIEVVWLLDKSESDPD